MKLHFSIPELQAKLAPDYLAALRARGQGDGNWLAIERADLVAVRALYEPAVRPVIPGGPPGAPDDRATAATIFETQPPSVMAPVPRAQWPAWASALAQQGHPSERGVGDTVARVLPPSSAALRLPYLISTPKRARQAGEINAAPTSRPLCLHSRAACLDLSHRQESRGPT